MNTKHIHQIVPAVLAAGFLVAACGTASADTLLSDNFNTGSAGTVDSFNGSLPGTRQTGSLAGTGYTSKGYSQQIDSNQVLIQPSWGFGRLFINHDFTDTAITSSGGFTISYDEIIPASASGNTSWLGIMFGQTSSFVNSETAPQINKSGTDFGMLLQGNGVYQSFDSGAGITGTTPLALNYDAANQVVLTVLTTSFASGSQATVSATVNGIAIDLGANANITWDADAANYIQFEAYQTSGYRMDNLAIGTVPEPGTMALAGLGGMSLLFWRRRSK